MNQKLKQSEAKILVFLSQIPQDLRYPAKISEKLLIDYVYIMRLLPQMVQKGWLKQQKTMRKTYYSLETGAPLDAAKDLLTYGYQEERIK